MKRMPKGEVREINWSHISVKEQADQLCRYCFAQYPGGESYGAKHATHMRKQGKQGWVPICKRHARILEPILPASLRAV